MSERDYIKLDFSLFPDHEGSAQVPGKMFIVDNLDKPEGTRYRNLNYPVQVTMAIGFVIMHGEIELTVGLEHYTLHEKQSILVQPGTILQIIRFSDDVRCIFSAVSPAFVDYSQDIRLGVELGRYVTENPVHTMSEDELDEMLTLYRIVKKKLLNKNFQFKDMIAKSYLNFMKCNMFQQILDNLDLEKQDKPTKRKEEIFYTFLAMVRDNYKAERGITFYADKMCMSPKYLSSVVHEVSGKYATEWINDHVVLEAKAMLRSPGVAVKDVTNALNFANQSFFAKFFKQHTGFTPREYMNM